MAQKRTRIEPAPSRHVKPRGAPVAPLLARSRPGVSSSHDQIVRALGEEILAGTYPPGANLPHEQSLLERFGVSRTVLREALKTLTAKGMIVAKTRIGTRVLDPVRWNFFDPDVLAWKVSLGMDLDFRLNLAEIRGALEPAAAALAAKRRTKQDILALRAAIAAMRAQTTERGFAVADLEFHMAVGAASGNPMMRSIASVIEAALIEAFSLSPPVRTDVLKKRTVDEHETIVDAIEARDSEGAARAMLHVIDSGMERIERERRGEARGRKTKAS